MISRIRSRITQNPKFLLTSLLLAVFLLTLVGCQSSQKAETPAPPSNAESSYNCDVVQGFNFEKDAESTIGYIEYLKIGGTKLKSDFSVVNPISENQAKVVGVLSNISWEGGYAEPIVFACQVSKANQTTIAGLIHQSLENTEVEFAFSVCDYDPRTKKYYKSFHSNSVNLQGLVLREGGDLAMEISSAPSGEVVSPKNFSFNLGVMPQDTAMDVYMAFSSKNKLVKPWGVEVDV